MTLCIERPRIANAATESKIEVTEEMIEAGECAYCEMEFDPESPSVVREMAEKIYRAMAAVDPQRCR